MLIAIVSDTHGHVEYTRSAIRLLESCRVEVVLHCGDIGSVQVVDLFQSWPTHFVFGNVDAEPEVLRAAMVSPGHQCHGRFGELELAGKRIAFLHGDDLSRLSAAVESGRYDLVCYGHTHQAEYHHVGRTIVLNPGALFRAQPHSVALVQLPALEITPVAL